MAATKAVILDEGPGWIPLAPDQFNARYTEVWDELWDLDGDAYLAGDGSQEQVRALFGELGDVPGSLHGGPPGADHHRPARRQREPDSRGHHLYGAALRHRHRRLPDLQVVHDTLDDRRIRLGRDSRRNLAATLTTPALSETRWFRVTVTNPGGSATSEAAHVEVYRIYTAPAFTSAASASAKVGVPFSWTFATNIPGAWIFIQGMNLPSWLNFSPMTGTLSGTPGAEGTWDIQVTASNQGSFGYQTFRLTVASPLMGDIDGNGSVTLADAVCALQVCAGIPPAAPVKVWGDVNGDGSIGLPEAIYVLQDTAELR